MSEANQQNPAIEITTMPVDQYHGHGGTFVLVDGVRVPAHPVTGLPQVSDEDPATPPDRLTPIPPGACHGL